jgi:hypothetical protein
MSGITEEFNNGNAAQFNRTVKKTFIGDTETEVANYTNSTYDAVTLLEGTLMGRVTATGKIKPLASGATDGSQDPVGVLLNTHVIEEGDTKSLAFAVSGRVAQECLVLDGTDTLDTIISGKRLRDRIAGSTLGIKIVPTSDDLTGFDNDLV